MPGIMMEVGSGCSMGRCSSASVHALLTTGTRRRPMLSASQRLAASVKAADRRCSSLLAAAVCTFLAAAFSGVAAFLRSAGNANSSSCSWRSEEPRRGRPDEGGMPPRPFPASLRTPLAPLCKEKEWTLSLIVGDHISSRSLNRMMAMCLGTSVVCLIFS
jgi:hypothetical protein